MAASIGSLVGCEATIGVTLSRTEFSHSLRRDAIAAANPCVDIGKRPHGYRFLFGSTALLAFAGGKFDRWEQAEIDVHRLK